MDLRSSSARLFRVNSSACFRAFLVSAGASEPRPLRSSLALRNSADRLRLLSLRGPGVLNGLGVPS